MFASSLRAPYLALSSISPSRPELSEPPAVAFAGSADREVELSRAEDLAALALG